MDMDRTKPDTSTPVPVHNVSSSMSTSVPSTIDASPSTVSQSKTSENLVVSGPSKRTPGPAVAPQTDLDNMDTSDTKPNENQEVPTSMDSNDDALLRLLLLSMLNNPNMGESMSDLLVASLSRVCFYGFRYELFQAGRGFCFVGAFEAHS